MKQGIFAYWPNRITMLRFVGSFVLFLVLDLGGMKTREEMSSGVFQLAFWLFLVVALTDALDGWLARRDNQVTSFGRIADPFVDKVLVIGSMVYLAVMPWSQGWFPAWIVVVVVAREFLVTGIRGYVESIGREFGADWFGKLKMIFQCVAIGTVLGQYAFPWPQPFLDFLGLCVHGLVWGTLVTTVGSGTSYVLKTRRLLADGAGAA